MTAQEDPVPETPAQDAREPNREADSIPVPSAGLPYGPTTVVEGFDERHAVAVEDGSPLSARGRNLLLVTDLLDRADIDYFVVRGMEDRASVVGVRRSEQTRVLSAVAAQMDLLPGYVRCLVPHGVGRNPVLLGNNASTWGRMKSVSVLRVFWVLTDGSRRLIYGQPYGCDIEFWDEGQDGRLVSPRPNRCTRTVEASDPVDVSVNRMSRMAGYLAKPDAPSGQTVRTLRDFDLRLPEDVTFPVDVVYTWVDGNEPTWAARRAAHLGESYHAEASSAARYLSRNELRYSLRSLHLYAPWVRRVFIVTDDQVPDWLAPDERVSVVSHREIFGDQDWLPTYNSHAIETQLHHIPGLAEHFVYLNDDMFFGRPTTPNAFFLSNGIVKNFPSLSRVPQGRITEADTPIDAACKNNRRLLENDFGATITQSMQHVPYALRREILYEIEERYPLAYSLTAASRFRSPTDHSFTSSLHQNYAYLTGRAVSGSVRYGYIQLAVPDLALRLERMLTRRDWDTFCLNDAYSTPEQLESQTRLLTNFLERYFPQAAPWERDR